MLDVERRCHRRDRQRRGQLGSGGQHGRAAKAVADQQVRRPACAGHMVGGGEQVTDIAAEARIGEASAAAAEAGEIEAQHPETASGECTGDPDRGQRVLGAGEAMREQRMTARRFIRKVESAGELVSRGADEVEGLRLHGAPSPGVAGSGRDYPVTASASISTS